jgi:hypothetical protein
VIMIERIVRIYKDGSITFHHHWTTYNRDALPNYPLRAAIDASHDDLFGKTKRSQKSYPYSSLFIQREHPLSSLLWSILSLRYAHRYPNLEPKNTILPPEIGQPIDVS